MCVSHVSIGIHESCRNVEFHFSSILYYLLIVECSSRQLLVNRLLWFLSKVIFDWTTFIFFCNSELCVTSISSFLLSLFSFSSTFTRRSWLFLKSCRYPSIFFLVLFIAKISVKVKLFLWKCFIIPERIPMQLQEYRIPQISYLVFFLLSPGWSSGHAQASICLTKLRNSNLLCCTLPYIVQDWSNYPCTSNLKEVINKLADTIS